MTTVRQPLSIVSVVKRNLHGGRACWQAFDIGRDADGIWLFAPGGSTFRSSDGNHNDQCEVEGGATPASIP